MFQLDVASLFERIGGPAALRRALREDNGSAPAEATVAMWKSRNRIAADWVMACIVSVLRRRPVDDIEEIVVDLPDNPF